MKKVVRLLLIRTAAVIAVAVSFVACHQKNTVTVQDASWQQHRLKMYDDSIYPDILKRIKPGFLIARLGSDITSELLRQMNQTDKSFSHCGIAFIENDTMFVYHELGGEFNPDQKLRRETLYSFCHPSDNKAIGIFDLKPDAAQIQKLYSVVQKLYRSGTPFDMKFDYKTDDRLYCAEFVTKAYSRGLGDSSWFSFSRADTLQYVAVDNITLSTKVHELKRWRY